MDINDIHPTAVPINLAEAANAIKHSQGYTGQQILNTMSDRQVVSLWQFGLMEARLLSEHNIRIGKPEVTYPHLWVRSNLFKLIYKRWVMQEEDALQILKKIEGIKEECQPISPPRERLASNDTPSQPAHSGNSNRPASKDWTDYLKKRNEVKSSLPPLVIDPTFKRADW